MAYRPPQGLKLDRDRPEHRIADARLLLRHAPLDAHDLSALEAALDPVEAVKAETVLASAGSLQPFAVAEARLYEAR